jgi:hypothetical protein
MLALHIDGEPFGENPIEPNVSEHTARNAQLTRFGSLQQLPDRAQHQVFQHRLDRRRCILAADVLRNTMGEFHHFRVVKVRKNASGVVDGETSCDLVG